MWWNELEDHVKVQVRRLIERGQLEIVLGGWVMPDEASTHYYSVIDQLMEGHQWVMENLHVKPINSWSIDPFGHSGTMPYLWKQSGLENMVIQRIHQSTKATLAQNRNLEFYWRQYWDTKGESDILCHVMPYILYGIKHTCGPNHHICVMYDFKQSTHWKPFTDTINLKNIKERARLLHQQYREKAYLYKYNTILVPLGDDFRYDVESEWDYQYQNYNMLMDYMNNKSEWNVNIRFGTLKDYFESLKFSADSVSKRSENLFKTFSGDFFPYSDKNSAYWTGYYTTRPFDKTFSRDVESNLRAAEILNVLTNAYIKKWKLPTPKYHEMATDLQTARRNLGLFLHHDAITGTSKFYVVEDYEKGLLEAYNGTQNVMKRAIQTLLSGGQLDKNVIINTAVDRPDFKTNSLNNILPVLESGTKVILYNPILHNRTEILTLFVDCSTLIIRGSKNEVIPHQINPVWDSIVSINTKVFQIKFLREMGSLSLDTVTLYRTDHLMPKEAFPAKVTTYNLQGIKLPRKIPFYVDLSRNPKTETVTLENDYLSVHFSSADGMIKSVLDKKSKKLTKIDLQFMVYKSRGSGAYLFYPSGEAKPVFTSSSRPSIRVITGPLMSQIDVVSHLLHHTVQVYHHPGVQGRGVRIENTLNILSDPGLQDSEIIMRFNTDISNNERTFHTDQNGYQLITRRTNPKLGIKANYFPMSTMSVLEEPGKRLVLHSGQSHGVASLKTGQLEVMLDRNLLYDDERGLGEGIQDNKITYSQFVLQLEPSSGPKTLTGTTFPSLLSMTANHHLQQPVIKFYTKINTAMLTNSFYPTSTFDFPCDVTLVSLKSLVNRNLDSRGTSLLLHRHGYLCDFPTEGLQCHISSNISINAIFKDLDVHSVRETTLTHMYDKQEFDKSTHLDIKPMEIAAYKFEV